MTRWQLFVSIACVLLAVVGYGAYRVIYTIKHLPEAYAAWDTGTLLVYYMQENDGRWPSDWDELISVRSETAPMLFSWGYIDPDGRVEIGDLVTHLRSFVEVDWSFNPTPGTTASPVTQPDGTPFSTVWEGGEPNEMVRSYIEYRAAHPAPPDNNPMQVESPTSRLGMVD